MYQTAQGNCRGSGGRSSLDAQKQTAQVLALRVAQGNRMVGASAEELDRLENMITEARARSKRRPKKGRSP